MSEFVFEAFVLCEMMDVVAMGSPLGPTLAMIFMSHNEQKWVGECPLSFKPKLYMRYVVDTSFI